MSTTTPQVVIAPGGSTQVDQPQYGGNLSAVVIANLSTYLLIIVIGPNSYYQAPLTAQIYSLEDTTAGLQATAIAEAGDVTTSGAIAPTWFSNGEPIPGTYPVALSGPAAIAAQTAADVAAALLATGVPNVLVQDVVLAPTLLAVNGNTGFIDMHDYSELIVKVTTNAGLASANYQVDWYDKTQTTILHSERLGGVTTLSWLTGPPFRNNGAPISSMAVRGYYAVVSNFGTANLTASLIGTNRTLNYGVSTETGTSEVDVWFNPLTTYNGGDITTLSESNPNVRLNGLVMASFYVQGTVVKGLFLMGTYVNGGFQSFEIANTSEMVLHSGNLYLTKQIAIPRTSYAFGFQCTASGTGSATSIFLTPCGS